jgi:DNA-binding CsgD family transcriptional regulator
VLTAAEREIVGGVVDGQSNAEIARRRRRSVRTVANQLAAIFRRLGVGSRLELIARCAPDFVRADVRVRGRSVFREWAPVG